VRIVNPAIKPVVELLQEKKAEAAKRLSDADTALAIMDDEREELAQNMTRMLEMRKAAQIEHTAFEMVLNDIMGWRT
jgi:hypothetical protein